MALKLAHMLSSSGLQPAPIARPAARVELFVRDTTKADHGALDDRKRDGATMPGWHRTRIWEFGTNLHCSIIGTCLSTAELRQILDKLKVNGAAVATDHDLHGMGVTLAGRREAGAKFLQKALDRRHSSAIARFSAAKEKATLLALWEDALKQGDIPGAYWAVLTHPATTDDVVKWVFGDVHMLSHLVGAANRADIRRLRQLEQANGALLAKVERQQRQLHEGFAGRDQTIRRLNDLLAQQAGERPARSDPLDARDDAGGVDALLHDLNRRLAWETARRERSERRVGELSAMLEDKERALRVSRQEREAFRAELEVIERQLADGNRAAARDLAASLDMCGVTLLYVGGRPHQIPQLKDMIERAGARFLHHDGGIEHSSSLMPGLVSRADHVFFPIDCISHGAAETIKRLCRVTDKPYEPLRTASLTCLLSALARMSGLRASAAAE